MQRFRQSRFIQMIVPLALIAFLPACHQWAPLRTPLDQTVTRDRSDQIRITRPDGAGPILGRPAVAGTGIGMVGGVREATTRIEYFDIATVGAPKTDPTSAMEMLVGTVVVGGMGFVVLTVWMGESLNY